MRHASDEAGMDTPSGVPADAVDRSCPACGEPPADVHLRGSEVVYVPCGHTLAAMAALEVPPEALEGGDAGP